MLMMTMISIYNDDYSDDDDSGGDEHDDRAINQNLPAAIAWNTTSFAEVIPIIIIIIIIHNHNYHHQYHNKHIW